jgi:hypothetical protein
MHEKLLAGGDARSCLERDRMLRDQLRVGADVSVVFTGLAAEPLDGRERCDIDSCW